MSHTTHRPPGTDWTDGACVVETAEGVPWDGVTCTLSRWESGHWMLDVKTDYPPLSPGRGVIRLAGNKSWPLEIVPYEALEQREP